jgi:hypothetical protein
MLELNNSGLIRPILQGHAEISVISVTQVRRLFNEFRNNTKLAWGYPIEGCEVRAMTMSQIAESQGVVFGRISAEGLLQAGTRNPRYPVVQWAWHTTPSVYVRTESGQVELMVIDPAIADGPISVNEWRNLLLSSKPGRIHLVPQIDRISHCSRFQLRPTDPANNCRGLTASIPRDLQFVQEMLPLLKQWAENPDTVPVTIERPPDVEEGAR